MIIQRIVNLLHIRFLYFITVLLVLLISVNLTIFSVIQVIDG